MRKYLKISFLFFALGLFLASCGEATQAAEKTADEVVDTAKDKAKKMTKKKASKGYEVGGTAEDFNLKNTKGEMVSMAGMSDAKGYIVTFTCNTCPYAIDYEDRLIALHKKYAPMGYPVIAINPNDPEVKEGDSYTAMQVRSKEKSFPFEYLFDEGQKVYPKYGATKTPHVFLLDKNLTVKYIGAIDDNHDDESMVKEKYVEAALAAMEAGKDPDPNFTKAIGCSIKTKKKMM